MSAEAREEAVERSRAEAAAARAAKREEKLEQARKLAGKSQHAQQEIRPHHWLC
jgi:hypothetical protein